MILTKELFYYLKGKEFHFIVSKLDRTVFFSFFDTISVCSAIRTPSREGACVHSVQVEADFGRLLVIN
jgi:hypothetical protein